MSARGDLESAIAHAMRGHRMDEWENRLLYAAVKFLAAEIEKTAP